ncbi:MAG: SsrA-binding protein SmpB [Parachlamydiales bacterium]|nr:SsrA-binding protein SmpB [Parachlamydiales bacterium]
MAKEKKTDNELVSNRRALHDYAVIETFEAGIVLQGTEIKSLRSHGGSLQDAYIKVIGHEAWLLNASIAPYRFGNLYNHEERRERKLLMHKREIEKLKGFAQEKGMALIPLAIYLIRGRAKLRLATAKGKKLYDKRQVLKSKEEDQRMRRAMKNLDD